MYVSIQKNSNLEKIKKGDGLLKIDFFRMLENNITNNKVKNFIEELSNCLEKKDNEQILDKIKKENKVSLISENRIIREEFEIREKYKNNPEKIKSEIMKMINRILKQQNEKLLEYRQEGHLYMVEEDVKERIYLLDLSTNTGKVFEEVDFPKTLIPQATEGAVFKYENGTYTFYSNDGFERIYDD